MKLVYPSEWYNQVSSKWRVYIPATDKGNSYTSSTINIKAKRVYEIPFDSTRKMMTVIMKEDNCETCYMKGAPERVINKCNYILENGSLHI